MLASLSLLPLTLFEPAGLQQSEPCSLKFHIIPTTLGSIDLTFSARSATQGDSVRRSLLVLPEGVQKRDTVSNLLEPAIGACLNCVEPF